MDNYEIYEEGNLKDITPSFVVALNMMISYFNSLGINNIVIPSLLVERWNAKKIASNIKYEKGKIDKNKFNELETKQQYIQSNLTDKLLRNFLRLNYHYNSIFVTSYPFELDSSMHINVSSMDKCNNKLLIETSDIIKKQNISKKR